MGGSRRKNKADMSIVEQIEAVKDQVCKEYCNRIDLVQKMLDNGELKSMKAADKWLEENECRKCPMMKI